MGIDDLLYTGGENAKRRKDLSDRLASIQGTPEAVGAAAREVAGGTAAGVVSGVPQAIESVKDAYNQFPTTVLNNKIADVTTRAGRALFTGETTPPAPPPAAAPAVAAPPPTPNPIIAQLPSAQSQQVLAGTVGSIPARQPVAAVQSIAQPPAAVIPQQQPGLRIAMPTPPAAPTFATDDGRGDGSFANAAARLIERRQANKLAQTDYQNRASAYQVASGNQLKIADLSNDQAKQQANVGLKTQELDIDRQKIAAGRNQSAEILAGLQRQYLAETDPTKKKKLADDIQAFSGKSTADKFVPIDVTIGTDPIMGTPIVKKGVFNTDTGQVVNPGETKNTVPPGYKQIGATKEGKPVYEGPDKKRYVSE